MTALLTVEEYAALGETEIGYTELVEGRLLVVVEVVSPGSKRTDYVTKRGEYADAGIPSYWIVDLHEPVSVLACTLTEEFGYVDSVEASGTFETTEPFAVKVELAELY